MSGPGAQNSPGQPQAAELSSPIDRKAPIATEAALIERNATYASEAQFEAANLWRGVHLWVAIPAAVLAAIAGGTALVTTAGRLAAGAIALAAAALSSISAVLGAPSRVSQHEAAGTNFLALRNDARVFRLVDLPQASFAKARSSLERLEARHDEITTQAVLTPRLAWWLARRRVNAGKLRRSIDATVTPPTHDPRQ